MQDSIIPSELSVLLDGPTSSDLLLLLLLTLSIDRISEPCS